MAENRSELIEKKAEKVNNINISPRKLVRTMFQGGLAAVLAACGAMNEAKQEIPQVELDKIIENPSLYAQAPILTTSGYPEKTGTEALKFPVYKAFVQVTFETDTYKLHTNPDVSSQSLEFTLTETTVGPMLAPTKTTIPQLDVKDRYDLTGRVIQIQTVDGKNMYIFQTGSYEKTGPTPQPTP